MLYQQQVCRTEKNKISLSYINIMNKLLPFAVIGAILIVYLFITFSGFGPRNISYIMGNEHSGNESIPNEMPCHSEQECIQYCMKNPDAFFCKEHRENARPCFTKGA